jgi:Leucine Rich repeat
VSGNMPRNFCNLSDDLVVLILSNWLDVLSLGSIDKAITNHSQRPRWLRCLRSIKDSYALDIWRYSHRSVRWLIARDIQLRRIQMMEPTNSRRVSSETFDGIHIPYLESIDLQDCVDIDDRCLFSLAIGCPRLQSVDLSRCYNLTDDGISALAKGCCQLRSIKLTSCKNIKDAGVTAIAMGCSELQSLDLTGLVCVRNTGITAIASGEIRSIEMKLIYC